MQKRTFLKSMAVADLGIPLYGNALTRWIAGFAHRPAGELARDETFWAG